MVNLEVSSGVPLPGGGGYRNHHKHEGYEDYENKDCEEYDRYHKNHHHHHFHHHSHQHHFNQFGHNKADLPISGITNDYSNEQQESKNLIKSNSNNAEADSISEIFTFTNNPVTETSEKPKIDVRSG